MAGALKVRASGAWQYVKGIKGDTGSAGPPSVGLTTLTADENQSIRQIGDAAPQVMFRRNKEAIINDRDSIDKTGATAMGSVINTYLAEFQSLGIQRVYFEGGTYGVDSTPIQPPSSDGLTIEGQTEKDWNSSATIFKALTGCTQVIYFAGTSHRLTKVQINQNNIATYGLHLNLCNNPEIDHIKVNGIPDTGTGIYGGGIENLRLHDFLVQVNGGTGIGTGIDLIQGNSSTTATYYGADNASYIGGGASSINGNGLLLRASGSCRIYDIDFEGAQRVALPGRVILGQNIAGPNGTGQSVNGQLRFYDNYFELSPLETGYTTLVPVAIYVADTSAARIRDNVIYGGNNYFSPGQGTAAIQFANTASPIKVTGNLIARWDVGILHPAGGNSTDTGIFVAANTWPGNQVNTQVSGGDYGTTSGGTQRPSPAYYQTKDGHLFQGGAIAQATYSQTSGTTVDCGRANVTVLDYNPAASITPANTRAGQAVTLYFKQAGATLPTASWNLLSGIDETPPVGTVKQFIVDQSGIVREVVGVKAKAPIAKTASFTAIPGECPIYYVDTTAGPVTMTLPDGRSSSLKSWAPIAAKKVSTDANALTIQTGAGLSQKIGGSTPPVGGVSTLVLGRFSDWVSLLTDGASPADFKIIAGNIVNGHTVMAELKHTGTTAGFFGATPVTKRTLAAAATDATTTQTLANSLRQALIDLGFGS